MSCREIVALLSGIIGLGAIIGATVSNEWKSTSRASSVITATWVFQGLWMNCAGNALGAVHCRQHHTIFKLDGYIQVCRGLMISAVCLGFFATACALLGMKCTKVGGNDRIKARIACCAGLQFFASGLCSLSACSLYAHRITSEFFDPMFMAQKYELGAALFIGWAGSALCILGGIVFFLSLSDGFNKSQTNTNGRRYVYHTTSYASSPGKSKNSTANGRKPPKDYSSTSLQFDKNAYV
ncbi:claudin-10-like isoform X2 [Trichomycterus rosablanca]|uniref:claudin-10-like isoform X2 n=1 Tax=Trichomycterus rosablanca TaxID=2290929 RepID=UPI002F357A14